MKIFGLPDVDVDVDTSDLPDVSARALISQTKASSLLDTLLNEIDKVNITNVPGTSFAFASLVKIPGPNRLIIYLTC